MKSSILQAGRSRSSAGKVMTGIVMASMMSGLFILPAFAAKDDGRGQADRHGNQNQRMHSRHYEGGSYRREYRHGYRQPYNYAQPVYAPPPVYYEQQQSPGISFFFPLDLR